MPIEEAGAAIKEKNPATLFHVDAIQSYGKLEIRPKRMNIDMLSVSGHKIHGPKGSGFLYIKDKTKIKPIIYGGGQQKGMRSGTENAMFLHMQVLEWQQRKFTRILIKKQHICMSLGIIL